MSRDVHPIDLVDGTQLARMDRVIVAAKFGLANVAGAAAGDAVTVDVAFVGQLPDLYGVFVNPGQDATWFVNAKTNAGFTVTLNPRLAANQLAAGTIDVLVLA